MERRLIGGVLCLWAAAAAAEVTVSTTPSGETVFTNTPSAAARTTVCSVPRPRSASYESIVRDHADRQQLDPKLVHAVIRAESAYDPRAVSSKGAMGLMQLMPETARELEVDDAFDPESNIAAGTRYLRRMLDQFEGQLELALAGYNAGPEAVRRFGGIPPFAETRRYIERILREYHDDVGYQLPRGGTMRVGRKVYLSRDRAGRLVLSTFRDD